jgi:multiple sugar transport system permease protein
MHREEAKAVVIFVTPFLLGYLMFEALPMVSAILISLTNINSLSGLRDLHSLGFAGLSNYAKALSDGPAMASFGRSLLFTLYYVPALNAFAILLALFITRSFYFTKFVRTLIFTPYVTNIVAVAILWGLLLNPYGGIVNETLKLMGVSQPPMWLYGMRTALPTLAGISVWKDVAFQMIVYMAAIKNVPSELYESAEVDGASKLRQFLSVTMPMISPTVFAMVVTSTISSFQNYALVRTMTNGGPGDASRVAVINIYEQAFEFNRFSYASAQAIMMLMVIMLITVVQWRAQKRWVHY